MLSILKDIPDFSLSCELDDFTIMADKAVTVVITQLGRQLFASKYVPDAGHEIHLRDLCSVLETYLTDEPMQLFSYSVSADNETIITKQFMVLMCRYNVSQTGLDFVRTHFLTNLIGRKHIGAESTEFLYFTNGSTSSAVTDAAKVTCTYVTTDNKIVQEDKALGSGVAGINKIDVSPSLFARSDMELVRYVVTVGSRSMRYDIHGRFTAAAIRFKNNFGCIETFTFAGTVEIDPQIGRSAALINGRLVNYDIHKEIHYKCYSSYIPYEMFFFADDIAASDDVNFVVGDQQFPVAVVESETPRSNSSEVLNSFWVEFVSADKRGCRLPELTRIFDSTFDNTYN